MPKTITVNNFNMGTIDTLEPQSLPRGAVSNALNWLTQADRLELRSGYKVYGNKDSSTGKITGYIVAKNSAGTEFAYRTHGQKLERYVSATDTWTELGTNALGTSADGKDISFAEWHPIAGDFVYLNSPYGPFLKIDLSAPDTATDVYNAAKNYKGYIKIAENRMWLWQRTADPTGVYISKINDPEDFTYSSPRVAAEGQIFRQDDGGPMQKIDTYGTKHFCFHKTKTWLLELTADDTNATNQIYRDRVGISSHRGAVSTGDGIYYMDDVDQKDPQIRLLTISESNAEIIPYSISKNISFEKKRVGVDLSDYRFDKACGEEWNDYILFACRTSDSTQNNRVLAYHKKLKSIDILDYWVTVFQILSGTLTGGDPVQNNIIQMFTETSDDSSIISNYVELNKDNLDFSGEKKLKKLRVWGRIGFEQQIKVYAKLDNNADFVELGTISGSDLDASDEVMIGNNVVGTTIIGGESSGEDWSEYVSEINLALGRFNYIILKFEALALGTASVSKVDYFDIRWKSLKLSSNLR